MGSHSVLWREVWSSSVPLLVNDLETLDLGQLQMNGSHVCDFGPFLSSDPPSA